MYASSWLRKLKKGERNNISKYMMCRIVLCFSPVGSTLRVRSRKFPAIVNCTATNWFHEWPQEALMSVSKQFLQELEELPESFRLEFTMTKVANPRTLKSSRESG